MKPLVFTRIHYVVSDTVKSAGNVFCEVMQDFYLDDGKIMVNDIASYFVDGKKKTYYFKGKEVSEKEYKKSEKKFLKKI